MGVEGNCLIFFVQMHPEVKIDAEDLTKYGIYKAVFSGDGYVRLSYRGKWEQLHRVLLGFPVNSVDHINQNKLDNRKNNLRIVTQAQNCANSSVSLNNSSGYKGVSWDKQNKKWRAKLTHNRKTIHIGCYSSAEKAAEAYNRKATELWGDLACLNKLS